jgi:hypothetical protein
MAEAFGLGNNAPDETARVRLFQLPTAGLVLVPPNRLIAALQQRHIGDRRKRDMVLQ